MNRGGSFIAFLAMIVVTFTIVGCEREPSINTPSVADPLDKVESVTELVYAYSGYSQNGTPIVRGQMILVPRDSGRFAGRWLLRALVDPARIGPQNGRGFLVGHLRGGNLNINLNPNFVDNNVLLTGSFHRERFSGQWSWVGFPGVLNSGRFQAIRVRTSVAENVE